MVVSIIVMIALYLLYILLIKGVLWKIMVGIFGWLGMYWVLNSMYDTRTFGITISGHIISWSLIIPTVIILLALLHTKDE